MVWIFHQHPGRSALGDTELTINTAGIRAVRNLLFHRGRGRGRSMDQGIIRLIADSACASIDISMDITDSGTSAWKALITADVTGTNVTGVTVNQDYTAGTIGTFVYEGSGNPAIATANVIHWGNHRQMDVIIAFRER